MTSHELWAHSHGDTENLGRTDGARVVAVSESGPALLQKAHTPVDPVARKRCGADGYEFRNRPSSSRNRDQAGSSSSIR
jgi:hypothetical protein